MQLNKMAFYCILKMKRSLLAIVLFVFIVWSRVRPPLNVTNDTETLFTFFVTVYLDI